MSDLVIDTHAAVWYFANSPELSTTARSKINDSIKKDGIIYLATISIVEIFYLIDKRRLNPQTLPRLIQALNLSNSTFTAVELTVGIAQTLQQIPRETVPDMSDRIISATALHLGPPLVTRDRMISRLTAVKTIW